jgi:hypothetical protein
MRYYINANIHKSPFEVKKTPPKTLSYNLGGVGGF